MAGQTITRPRGERTQRYVFYLGVVLAAIAAIVVFVAINPASSGGGSGDEVAVVRASQDIPAQTRITSDLLKVEFLPADQANPDAFTSKAQLLDRVVAHDVPADAQVLPSMVSDVVGVDSLAFKVDPGMRGVSVSVSEVVTAGGNIRPGDRVDVVGIFEVGSVAAANDLLTQFGTGYKISQPPEAASDATVGNRYVLTTTLLQNVKVLALAQTLTKTTAAGTVADKTKEADTEPNADTATLQVAPDQAQTVTTADKYGIIRLDVRPPGDQDAVEVQPTLVTVNPTR
jgi:Flp pilus assembly protein CpaB